jgi:P4 family phage/plasmid primase-like protien
MENNEINKNEYMVSCAADEHVVSLVTGFGCGWKTRVVVDEKKSAPIQHKNPIFMYEPVRDRKFGEAITGKIRSMKPREAAVIVNELIDKASNYEEDIRVRCVESHKMKQSEEEIEKAEAEKAIAEAELEEKEQEKKLKEAQLKQYLDILRNESGTCTEEEIEAARIGLKDILMPTFWHAKITKENEVTVVLNKLPIADYIRIAHNVLRCGLHTWRYDWQNAYYTYDNEDETLRQLIMQIMHEVGGNHTYNGHILSEMEQILMGASYGPDNVYTTSPFNKCKGLINAKNGVVKLDYEKRTATLIGKKPQYKFNYCIDTIYDPAADSGPIDKFLEEIVGPDQKEYIYQMAALAIRDADVELEPSKVCYFIQGPRNTGKNHLLKVLSTFLGNSNTSTIPLHELAEDKFVKALLEGKLINVNDEVPISLAMDESREIKTLTGGKMHTLNPKRVQQYQGIITALLVFAGNHFPRCHIPKDDLAFWGRWDILHCDHVFAVNEKKGQEIFTPENMSGFFNKVVEKLFDLHESGIKRRCASPEQTYAEWMSNSSSVYRFVQDMLVESDEINAFPSSVLHDMYLNWCQNPANNISKERIRENPADFGRDLINECSADKGREGSDKSKVYVYRMHKKFKLAPAAIAQSVVSTEVVASEW